MWARVTGALCLGLLALIFIGSIGRGDAVEPLPIAIFVLLALFCANAAVRFAKGLGVTFYADRVNIRSSHRNWTFARDDVDSFERGHLSLSVTPKLKVTMVDGTTKNVGLDGRLSRKDSFTHVLAELNRWLED